MEPTKVVVRYANGTVAKGFLQNFSPNKDFFYLTPLLTTPPAGRFRYLCNA